MSTPLICFTIAWITCDMTGMASLPLRLSWLAILCACAVLFAWAAPVLVDVIHDSLEFLKMNQSNRAGDLADSQAEALDVTDDLVMPVSIGVAGLHPLIFSLHASHPTYWTWSPTLPVRPPIVLN